MDNAGNVTINLAAAEAELTNLRESNLTVTKDSVKSEINLQKEKLKA